jgi:hypothetical protein
MIDVPKIPKPDPMVHFTRYDPVTGEITASGVAQQSRLLDLYGPFVLETLSVPGVHAVDLGQDPPAVVVRESDPE